MQCTIPSQNMKILVRGLHSLARIGDDLYIESTDEGLRFRTVNGAQSAYSSLVFYIPFFSSYKSEFKNETNGKCKLSMKSCLSVFKTPHSMDRNVESCQISINEECVKVSFQVLFVQGYTKNYCLSVTDNVNVQLNYNKNDTCNKMSIVSKTLHGAIKHFRANEEEITLSVKPDKALLRNYFPHSEVDNQKVVRTNLSLQSSEFEAFEINQPGSITFTLRELRAVCTFSELSNSSPVGIYFEKAGKPVIFSVYNSLQYEADYVISTLPPDMINGERPHRRSQLSDVVSSVPSTTAGITRERKRKLAPVTEEEESPSTPQGRKSNEICSPQVSLVDIIKYSDENRLSPTSKSNTNIDDKSRPIQNNAFSEPNRQLCWQSFQQSCIREPLIEPEKENSSQKSHPSRTKNLIEFTSRNSGQSSTPSRIQETPQEPEKQSNPLGSLRSHVQSNTILESEQKSSLQLPHQSQAQETLIQSDRLSSIASSHRTIIRGSFESDSQDISRTLTKNRLPGTSEELSLQTCIPDTDEHQSMLETPRNIENNEFFPDDLNEECLNMICDQVDRISKSQNDRINNVFQYCYNYSSDSSLLSDSEILYVFSDTKC